MKSIEDILSILHEDISTNLPSLLSAVDLDDFDVYKIGGSRNAKENGLFVYQNEYNYSVDKEDISISILLQLYGKKEIVSAQYTDIILEYLKDYDPKNIEADLLNSINIEAYPLDQTSTAFIEFIISWSSVLDSCD